MEAYRSYLFSFAYNICGSAEDAEDIVQEAFLKYLQVDKTAVKNEKSYLTRMVINLAINYKNKQKKQQIYYPGDWLPEPIETDNFESKIVQKEILSYSLLVLLEKLDVKQRAVFMLKEAFNYNHQDIADLLEISPELSRQLLSRAKKLLSATVKSPSPIDDNSFLEKYIHAIQSGDAEMLEKLLKEDIIITSDGGGKVSAGRKPVFGLANALAMLRGIYRKFYKNPILVPTQVNHQPAILYFSEDHQLQNCQVFDIEDGKIKNIYFMRNPEKLDFLKKKHK